MLDLRLPVIQRLQVSLEELFPEQAKNFSLETPPRLEGQDLGYDVAIPCFPLAKSLRKPPPKIAAELAEQLRARCEKDFEKVEAIQAYVNLRYREPIIAEMLNEKQKNILARSSVALSAERIVIEFSSPNIAKPFSIGHLRSTNIGAALSRIFKALGAEVIRINHLGDWGTQFGKLITAYKRFGSAEFVKGDPINNLLKLYVEYHEREKEDPALADEARAWFVKLEKGDEEALELWRWFKDVSYQEFKRIYDRLGVEFDYITGESFYGSLMTVTVEHLEKKSLLLESQGAMVVDLEPYGMPPCLIRKTDGSTLYATRDLAAAEYRLKTFQPSRVIYVVGGEQKLHFNQVFKVMDLLGYEYSAKAVHVDFGLIKFPEGKMSTRKGNIIRLEEVLDQAQQEALRVMKERVEGRGETLPDENQQIEIAQLVGTGAVIFFDLHAKRTKDILFSWSDILNFEGDSGPYLQYTAVRLAALLDRVSRESELKSDTAIVKKITSEEERDLARALLAYAPHLEAAARDHEPSLLAHYLVELCSVFNRFYMNVPILKGEKELMESRLALVKLSRDTLIHALGLLGIQCPSRM